MQAKKKSTCKRDRAQAHIYENAEGNDDCESTNGAIERGQTKMGRRQTKNELYLSPCYRSDVKITWQLMYNGRALGEPESLSPASAATTQQAPQPSLTSAQ